MKQLTTIALLLTLGVLLTSAGCDWNNMFSNNDNEVKADNPADAADAATLDEQRSLIEKLQAENVSLTNDNIDLATQLTTMNQRLTEQDATLATQDRMLSSLAAAVAERDALEVENATLKTEITEVQKQLSLLNMKIVDMEDQLAGAPVATTNESPAEVEPVIEEAPEVDEILIETPAEDVEEEFEQPAIEFGR